MSERTAYRRKTESAAKAIEKASRPPEYDPLEDVVKACEAWDKRRVVTYKRKQVIPQWHRQWQPKTNAVPLRVLLIRASVQYGIWAGLVRRASSEGWEDWIQDGEKDSDAERVAEVVAAYRQRHRELVAESRAQVAKLIAEGRVTMNQQPLIDKGESIR